MSRASTPVVALVLVLGGLSAWLLLREPVPPAVPSAPDSVPVVHLPDPPPSAGSALPRAEAAQPVPLVPRASGSSPSPAQRDPAQPVLSVRWTGTPVPMTRVPLPDMLGQPSDRAAHPGVTLVRAPLSTDGSAVSLALAAGSNDLVLRSGGGAVWRDRRELHAGSQELLLDAARLPGVLGRCLDERGAPLEGVTVSIAAVPAGSAVRVVSGADGGFTVPFLSAERLHEGRAAKPGYLETARDALLLEPGRLTVLEPFVLRPARSVSGRVELPDGTPVVHCVVTVTALAPGTSAHAEAATDAEGRFRFDRLPPGTVRVATGHSLLVNASVTLPDAPTERTVTLVLTEGVFVTGTVRCADGSTVLGLQLAGRPLARPDGTDAEAGTQFHQVEWGGKEFSLGPFPPGPVEVTDASGRLEPRVVDAPGTLDLLVPAPRSLRVAFRFTEALTGVPITRKGHLAWWTSAGRSTAVTGDSRVQPDEHGVLTLQRVFPPLLEVAAVVGFEGCRPVRLGHIDALSDDAPPIDVTVEVQPMLAVRVFDVAGAPVAGARVYTAWCVEESVLVENQLSRALVNMDSSEREWWGPARQDWFAGCTALVSSAKTDAEGLASVERIAEGALVCLVQAEGFLASFTRLAAPPAPPQPGAGDAAAYGLVVTLVPTPSPAP